jgi:hypothetical protein
MFTLFRKALKILGKLAERGQILEMPPQIFASRAKTEAMTRRRIHEARGSL